MDYPLPRWIAHRGGGALAPENTLAGFRLAARLGFKAVEFDVMLSRDGIPVLLHDETLDRTTDGTGLLCEQDWADLAGIDAGRKFHKAWRGEYLPRLEEALELADRLGLALNVEIKPAPGHEEATGTVVATAVAHCWRAGPSLLLSSFSERALQAAAKEAPQLSRALLVEAVPADWLARARALGCRALHARAAAIDDGIAKAAQAAGIPLAAYTVNTVAEAERCFSLGVSALFTDRLDCLGPL